MTKTFTGFPDIQQICEVFDFHHERIYQTLLDEMKSNYFDGQINRIHKKLNNKTTFKLNAKITRSGLTLLNSLGAQQIQYKYFQTFLDPWQAQT